MIQTAISAPSYWPVVSVLPALIESQPISIRGTRSGPVDLVEIWLIRVFSRKDVFYIRLSIR